MDSGKCFVAKTMVIAEPNEPNPVSGSVCGVPCGRQSKPLLLRVGESFDRDYGMDQMRFTHPAEEEARPRKIGPNEAKLASDTKDSI